MLFSKTVMTRRSIEGPEYHRYEERFWLHLHGRRFNYLCNRLHCVTSLKTHIFIVTAIRMPNITKYGINLIYQIQK